MRARPTIVCLCGSTKFKDAWIEANLNETMSGRIVLSVGCYGHSDTELHLTRHEKAFLDVLHLQKVMLADEILVLNVEGYVGESTEREIEFALSTGTRVRWWDPDKIPETWRSPDPLEAGLITMQDAAGFMGVHVPPGRGENIN